MAYNTNELMDRFWNHLFLKNGPSLRVKYNRKKGTRQVVKVAADSVTPSVFRRGIASVAGPRVVAFFEELISTARLQEADVYNYIVTNFDRFRRQVESDDVDVYLKSLLTTYLDTKKINRKLFPEFAGIKNRTRLINVLVQQFDAGNDSGGAGSATVREFLQPIIVQGTMKKITEAMSAGGKLEDILDNNLVPESFRSIRGSSSENLFEILNISDLVDCIRVYGFLENGNRGATGGSSTKPGLLVDVVNNLIFTLESTSGPEEYDRDFSALSIAELVELCIDRGLPISTREAEQLSAEDRRQFEALKRGTLVPYNTIEITKQILDIGLTNLDAGFVLDEETTALLRSYEADKKNTSVAKKIVQAYVKSLPDKIGEFAESITFQDSLEYLLSRAVGIDSYDFDRLFEAKKTVEQPSLGVLRGIVARVARRARGGHGMSAVDVLKNPDMRDMFDEELGRLEVTRRRALVKRVMMDTKLDDAKTLDVLSNIRFIFSPETRLEDDATTSARKPPPPAVRRFARTHTAKSLFARSDIELSAYREIRSNGREIFRGLFSNPDKTVELDRTKVVVSADNLAKRLLDIVPLQQRLKNKTQLMDIPEDTTDSSIVRKADEIMAQLSLEIFDRIFDLKTEVEALADDIRVTRVGTIAEKFERFVFNRTDGTVNDYAMKARPFVYVSMAGPEAFPWFFSQSDDIKYNLLTDFSWAAIAPEYFSCLSELERLINTNQLKHYAQQLLTAGPLGLAVKTRPELPKSKDLVKIVLTDVRDVPLTPKQLTNTTFKLTPDGRRTVATAAAAVTKKDPEAAAEFMLTPTGELILGTRTVQSNVAKFSAIGGGTDAIVLYKDGTLSLLSVTADDVKTDRVGPAGLTFSLAYMSSVDALLLVKTYNNCEQCAKTTSFECCPGFNYCPKCIPKSCDKCSSSGTTTMPSKKRKTLYTYILYENMKALSFPSGMKEVTIVRRDDENVDRLALVLGDDVTFVPSLESELLDIVEKLKRHRWPVNFDNLNLRIRPNAVILYFNIPTLVKGFLNVINWRDKVVEFFRKNHLDMSDDDRKRASYDKILEDIRDNNMKFLWSGKTTASGGVIDLRKLTVIDEHGTQAIPQSLVRHPLYAYLKSLVVINDAEYKNLSKDIFESLRVRRPGGGGRTAADPKHAGRLARVETLRNVFARLYKRTYDDFCVFFERYLYSSARPDYDTTMDSLVDTVESAIACKEIESAKALEKIKVGPKEVEEINALIKSINSKLLSDQVSAGILYEYYADDAPAYKKELVYFKLQLELFDSLLDSSRSSLVSSGQDMPTLIFHYISANLPEAASNDKLVLLNHRLYTALKSVDPGPSPEDSQILFLRYKEAAQNELETIADKLVALPFAEAVRSEIALAPEEDRDTIETMSNIVANMPAFVTTKELEHITNHYSIFNEIVEQLAPTDREEYIDVTRLRMTSATGTTFNRVVFKILKYNDCFNDSGDDKKLKKQRQKIQEALETIRTLTENDITWYWVAETSDRYVRQRHKDWVSVNHLRNKKWDWFKSASGPCPPNYLAFLNQVIKILKKHSEKVHKHQTVDSVGHHVDDIIYKTIQRLNEYKDRQKTTTGRSAECKIGEKELVKVIESFYKLEYQWAGQLEYISRLRSKLEGMPEDVIGLILSGGIPAGTDKRCAELMSLPNAAFDMETFVRLEGLLSTKERPANPVALVKQLNLLATQINQRNVKLGQMSRAARLLTSSPVV